MRRKNKERMFVGACIAIVCVLILILSSTAGFKRFMKSTFSSFSGLDRTITVYDYDGDVVRQWSGKFDVSSSEYEVYFDDENNHRVIIHGGIVINEEN